MFVACTVSLNALKKRTENQRIIYIEKKAAGRKKTKWVHVCLVALQHPGDDLADGNHPSFLLYSVPLLVICWSFFINFFFYIIYILLINTSLPRLFIFSSLGQNSTCWKECERHHLFMYDIQVDNWVLSIFAQGHLSLCLQRSNQWLTWQLHNSLCDHLTRLLRFWIVGVPSSCVSI